MRTVLQYFNPAMPFSDKQCMLIKMSSYGNMPDHVLIFNFDTNIDIFVTV